MAEVEAPEIHTQDQAPVGILSGDVAAGIASEIETKSEKEAVPKEANGVKKENVPPKRPAVSAARRPATGAASTSSTTKPTAPAAQTVKTTGGLSKPPTRPAAGSAVRKPAGSATAPTSASSAHKSQTSVGGSGDEKKKPLVTVAKRTSLASSGAHHSPAKTETLAEKRGTAAPTTTVRNPATSTSSSSPKPAVKPATSTPSATARATGTASATTSRTAPTSKPATAGAVADAKKRTSIISGSPPVSRTSTRPASHTAAASISSKEVGELKAKLGDSETRVEELQKEIASSQEKLLELGKDMEEEAKRVAEAEENIRTQHSEIIEKLHATRKADIEGLQAQLAEAEIAKKAALESAAKDALNAAEILEKIKAEHTLVLEDINLELTSAKEANTAAASAVSEKDGEIANLKSQIDSAKTELEALKTEYKTKVASQTAEHKKVLGDLQKSLAAEHESTLSGLKLAHSADLAQCNSEATSSYEKQVAELTSKHGIATKELQTQLKEAVAAQAALEASHKSRFETQQADSSAAISKLTKNIAELQEKSKSTHQQLLSAQEQHALGSKKHEAFRTTSENELAKSKQVIKSLQETMDADGKLKDQQYAKVKAEHAANLKNLEDKTKEMATLQEKHRKELETISNDYEKEIEALQGFSGMKEELDDFKARHEKLTKDYSSANASHATEVEQLKQGHAAAVAAFDSKEAGHQKALEELKATHAKNLDEAYDRAITAGHTAHAADLEQLRENHADAMATLKKEFASSQTIASSDAEKRKVAETAVQAEISKTKASLLKTQDESDALKQALAHEKMARTSAEADLDAIKNKKPDTSEVDALRKALQTLKDQHQASLVIAQQESAKATEEHLAVKTTLERVQAELDKQKSDAEIKSKTASADYQDLHDSMTQLVEEANNKAVQLDARLKEAEANLKVKEAELTEAKTKVITIPSPKTPTRKPARGLAASRFAEEIEPATTEAKSGAAEGEQDSSSAALASLAKARVTAKQLEQMNEDLQKDNLRSLKSITHVSPSSPPA